MQQKNIKSARFQRKREEHKKSAKEGDTGYEEGLKDFHSDEEPESVQNQKEDMKMYLSKLNSRIDKLVEALKKAELMIARQTSKKNLDQQVIAIANSTVERMDKQSVADCF